MLLHRISADQHAGSNIQNGDASGRMSGQMNDPELPVSKIQLIAVLHRDQPAAFAAAPVVCLFRRMHIERIELFIAPGVIHVRMCIQKFDRQ